MKMAQYKLILCFLISLCLILPFTQASNFQYCDKDKDYAVKVTGVKISPNPVKGGQPATFTISAETSQTISGGKLNVQVKYFGFPVYSQDHDLCDETSCPISGGNFVVSHSQELPGFTPHGPYSLTMKMSNEEGDELTCISFSFRIGSASSVADI